MDVTYRFVSSGHGDVEKAFTGIEARAKASKRATDDAAKATQRATAPAGTRQRVSAEDRAAAAKQRADDRAAAAGARAAKREADTKIREHERAQKHVSRIRDRHFADEQRKHDRHARELAKREVAARERAQREASGRRAQSFGTLRDIGTGALLGGVATGGALIGAAAKESIQLQEAAARIAINSRKAGEKGRDPNGLRRSFEQTALNAPGIKAIDVADAVGRFVSLTGDADTALKSQGTFATVASASGANIGDVAEAAASLSQQFDIAGLEDMKDALAALTFQGKEGSFELKDAAAQFQRLAASGAAFGIPKGVSGVKTLGGLTQIARSGTGSAEQAATAVENLLTNLKVKQKELGAEGVDVFDKGGKARDVRDLIVESISKVGGADMAKKNMGLTKIFGEQGIRAINPLIAKYSAAVQGTAGSEEQKTAAGIAALREEIERSINAPGEWADVVDDAAMAQKSASAQISHAWETITAKTADALLPALTKAAAWADEQVSAGALDPFIEAAGIAADALVALAEAVGFKKVKTKSQVADDAQKALERFDKKRAIGPLSAEDQARRVALETAATATKDAAFQKMGAPASLDDYVTRYMQAGGMDAEDRDAVAMDFKALKKNPMDSFRSNDWAQRVFGGENQAQQDVRRQFQQDVTSGKTLSTDGAQEALDSFAKKLASVQVPQGTIVPGADTAVR